MDDYERMGNNDEDYEENVFIDEKEAVFEEDLFIDSDLRKIKENSDIKVKDDDFYEEPIEEEIEVQKTLDETKPIIIPKKESKTLYEKKEVKLSTNKKEGEGDKVEKEKSNNKPTQKVPSKKSTTKKKPAKKAQKKKSYFWPIFLSIVGIVIIIWAIFYLKDVLQPTTPGVAAIVNGQEISVEELNKEYEFFFLLGGLPESYKDIITKGDFLNSSLIAEVLILQEAEDLGISVDIVESETLLLSSLENSGISVEDFEITLTERGLTLEEANKYFNYQLISFKLLNETVLGEIEVSDEEVQAAYEENKELFEAQEQAFEDLKDDLKEIMLGQKQREAAQLYLYSLRLTSDVEILYTGEVYQPVVEQPIIEEEVIGEETTTITTFKATGDELCTEEGKPLVILYSTTTCPHCVWMKDTFDSVVSEYDNIAAYHWELDKGDNILTEFMESTLPKEHINILKAYNPNGYVPAFVVGCKYFRIGNGYESSQDLTSEAAELRAVIDSVIA